MPVDTTESDLASADAAPDSFATYSTSHDFDAGHSLSVTVLEAIEAATGRDPLDLPQALHEAVDSDALDKLFRPTHLSASRTAGTVTFPLDGCEVTVYAAGDVVVSTTDPPARTSTEP